MLQSRGKVHEIIHHMLQEDADVEWSAIKRKLTSNYGSTQSGIMASVKISKLSMNSEETVGEYLARAKTLVKSKLKDTTAWHHDIDEAGAYHICNGIIKTGLKSRMLRRISQFKTYKDLFNNIEEEWDQSYFMEDDFASKEDTPTTVTEVDKINTWNETITDNPIEAEIIAEVNEVYHKYGRYPSHCRYWTPGPRSQNPRAPFRGARGYHKSFPLRYNNPRHQNTTVANQAYIFNSTTPNTNVSYALGTFNMGTPFNMYQVPYNQQQNQTYAQNQQYHSNSFAEQSSKTPQQDATAIIEQLQQRAETTHSPSQSKATKTIHKSPDGAKTKQKNTEDHQGQPESMVRPTQTEKTEEPQEQKSHEEILSVHIDDTQKSTYTAKVGSMEATALFDSGTTLSCISKLFYNHISCMEPSKVINTNAGPAIVVTSASDDELINLG